MDETEKTLDIKMLDKIVKDTMAAVEKSKERIYDIYEAARVEAEHVKKDLERVKQEAADVIFVVDEVEKRERRARLKLMEVSRNFRVYAEEDIKKAYDEAKNFQVELAVTREQEQNLRRQRDDLEIRLKTLKGTVAKAEDLTTQVGAVLGYLGNQMDGVVNTIESMQQTQQFGAKIIKAQEEERRRVSREIHDGPAQAMANIVFRAEVCERLIDVDVERSKRELGVLREQVRGCLKETRKIIFDLRPMTLDDLGLVPTVRRIVDNIKERQSLFGEVQVIGEERRLDAYVEIGLFRIIQEALNNVEKHAKATQVRVLVEFHRDFIQAVVEDDGRGFDAEAASGNESFGLMGMRERVNLLKGELTLKSAPGQGTRIAVRVSFKL
ncbi:sensor histidine kinase [Azotosporobacter soli]|uniref:sensor histidine kinase n=1 Tax=Azotosporobacter soli TaxID=3055040 RepID=UPI0031FF0ECF